LNARQGALVHNALRVTNVGTQKGTVSLIAADASTAQMTGIVYTSANPAQHEEAGPAGRATTKKRTRRRRR